MARFTVGAIALPWIAAALTAILWPRYFRRLAKRNELAHEIADPAHGAILLVVGGLMGFIYSAFWVLVISRVEAPLVSIIREFPNQAPAPLAIGFGFHGVGFGLWWAPSSQSYRWLSPLTCLMRSWMPPHLLRSPPRQSASSSGSSSQARQLLR